MNLLKKKTIFWSSTWLQNKSQKNEQAWLVYPKKKKGLIPSFTTLPMIDKVFIQLSFMLPIKQTRFSVEIDHQHPMAEPEIYLLGGHL